MNKKLKSIEVGLIGCGDAVTLNASDTATEPIATYALDKFKAEEQMSFKDNGKEYFVPFHAVDHIYVTESETSVADRPDPYGCEAEGGGGEGEVWYTGTLGECNDGWAETQLTATDKANSADLVTNPTNYSVMVNGVEQVVTVVAEGEAISFTDNASTPSIEGMIHFEEGEFSGDTAFKCPTDTRTVEVTVAKK